MTETLSGAMYFKRFHLLQTASEMNFVQKGIWSDENI